ncbi:beta/alpha barrel domain-containing protein [Candidatus Fokinia solitaria]|nr:hypothetical protein [Candidatus Fokinia solitaria]
MTTSDSTTTNDAILSLSKIIEENYKAREEEVKERLLKLIKCGVCDDKGIVIMAVDQGFEHGPVKSFDVNPAAYDPLYHLDLAVECGLNGIAAPLGFMETIYGSDNYEKICKILKLNSNCSAIHEGEHSQALLSTPEDAVRLGCDGIGMTIYPGTGKSNVRMMERASRMIAEARERGLFSVIWSYPRGDGVKGEEQSVDNISYAVHIACMLGADIVKVKMPKIHDMDSIAREISKYFTDGERWYDNEYSKKMHGLDDYSCIALAINYLEQLRKHSVALNSTQEQNRIKVLQDGLSNYFEQLKNKKIISIEKVMQAAFDSRRIVIFSGGETKAIGEVERDIMYAIDGGGNGSIIGRNVFQRPREEAITLLNDITGLYRMRDESLLTSLLRLENAKLKNTAA